MKKNEIEILDDLKLSIKNYQKKKKKTLIPLYKNTVLMIFLCINLQKDEGGKLKNLSDVYHTLFL